MSKPNILSLDRDAARYFVDVAMSASSRDDITPVICGALVQVGEDHLRVTCTDRYRVHSARIPLKSEGEKRPDFEFIMPLSSLLWLSKNLAYFGSYQKSLNRIEFEVSDHIEVAGQKIAGRLTVTVMQSEVEGADRLVWSGSHTRGNFPPVYRLMTTARDASPSSVPVSANLSFLSAARVLGQGGAQDAPIIKFTDNVDNPSRPGPIYMSWSRSSDDLPYAEAMVQPRLLLR